MLDQVKEEKTERLVRRFIDTTRRTVTKRSVPKEVESRLNSYLHKQDSSRSKGWCFRRIDVLLVDLIEIAFSIVAIFLFTLRSALFEVNPGIFPLLYVGIILVAAIYKLNTQNLLHDKALTFKFEIRKYYLTRHLWIDLLLLLLCFLEYFHVASGVFRLVAFLKLKDVSNVLDKFDLLIRVNRTWFTIWRILYVILVNTFVAHIVSLILFWMVDDNQLPNWMEKNQLLRHQSEWISVYAWGFYRAATNNFEPETPIEAIIMAFLSLFSIVLFCYSFDEVAVLLASLRHDNQAKTHKLSVVNRYMNTNHVPYSLQAEVKKTIGHMTDTEKSAKV
jgi:hypothetical protein